MPRSGATFDERPWYGLAATGHKSVISAGPWMYRGDPHYAKDVPGVHRVWYCLDAVLCRRVGVQRVAIYGRDTSNGIDHAIRAYAAVRGITYLPVAPSRDVWKEASTFRRDLEIVGRSHAVLWFGEEESDGDPARLAQILGIPVQLIPTVS